MIAKDLRKRLKAVSVKRDDVKIPAFVGDLRTGEVRVSGRLNWIYVTVAYNGQVLQVRNNKTPNRYKYPVLLGYLEGSHLLQVIGEREGVYPTLDLPVLPDHDHSWGKSDNPTWVRREQIVELSPIATGGMTVRVNSGVYKINDYTGAIFDTDFDLTAEVPTTGANWVIASIDNTGATNITADPTSYANRTLLTIDNIPNPPEGELMLFACKVYAGQTSIIQNLTDTDVFDPRFISEIKTKFEFIDFDLAGNATPEVQGRLSWNPDEMTLDLGMGDGIVGQLLHELFYDVINQTGATVTDGTPVMFDGTLGSSGRLLIQKAIANGTLRSDYMMGIVTHDISDGEEGKVTWFGKVRGIDTTGTPYGQTWADGDLLWVSQSTAGYLTNVEPTSGQKILVAAVIHAAANGTLFVRPTWTSTLTASDIPNLDASKITSGTIATARLGSGTADNSTILRGDNKWINRSRAETNANDIFRVDSPGGTSSFVGTINGTPSGASVTYNVTSGNEGAMVPTSTSQLAKMRLYNTTRGNYALISNCNTTTNVITLTANAPANWANGDTITIASQTVSGAGVGWVDLEITSGILNKEALFLNCIINSATVGHEFYLHPFETYSASKATQDQVDVSSVSKRIMRLYSVNTNIITCGWSGTPTVFVLREAGFLA